jgi:hypothetical protein
MLCAILNYQRKERVWPQWTLSGLSQITRLLQGKEYQLVVSIVSINIYCYFIFLTNTTSLLLRSASKLLKKKQLHNRRKGVKSQAVMSTTAQHLMFSRRARTTITILQWCSMYLVNPCESKVSGLRLVGYRAEPVLVFPSLTSNEEKLINVGIPETLLLPSQRIRRSRHR